MKRSIALIGSVVILLVLLSVSFVEAEQQAPGTPSLRWVTTGVSTAELRADSITNGGFAGSGAMTWDVYFRFPVSVAAPYPGVSITPGPLFVAQSPCGFTTNVTVGAPSEPGGTGDRGVLINGFCSSGIANNPVTGSDILVATIHLTGCPSQPFVMDLDTGEAVFGSGVTQLVDTIPDPYGLTAQDLTDGSPMCSAPVCFATADDGTTVFATANAHAVQQAVDAASPGGTVKVAGTCVGVESRGGTSQSTYISKTLTLSGGYTTTNWTTSQPHTQPTILDAAGGGRVIFATQNLTVTALTLQNGNASGTGGGLMAGAALVLSSVGVVSNTATEANGGGVFATDGATVTGGIFRANRCVGDCSGGGLSSDSGPLVVSGAQFIDNTAGVYGGGVHGAASLVLTATTFVGNVAATGEGGAVRNFGGPSVIVNSTFAGGKAGTFGGGAYFTGNASLVDTAFTGNSASEGGGAEFDGTAALTATTFISNWASLGGGALFYGASPRQVVNSLFAANTATMSGTAVYVYDAAPLTLIHTTMTSPTLAANGAVFVVGGAVYLTNTLIASHTVGIVLVGGAVAEDYTLFDGVTTPRSGAVQVGANSFTGAAAFFDTTSYTLTAASAAINRGVDAGAYVDFEGASRPQAGGFDIGYDESPFPSQYALTVSESGSGGGTVGSEPPGIDCGGDCGEAYHYGTVVTLTSSPAAGSTFAGWSGACGGSGACSVTMDAAKSVTATFTLNNSLLTTATVGTGSGSVGLNPAGGTYSHGTVVAVTASPAAGSTFAGWSGACGGSGACSVTMDAAKSVTATFTLNNYLLTTATVGTGSGSVGLNPAGGTYSHGTVVAVTASPAAGSTFAGWSGACDGSGACSVTIDAAKSVTATFTLTSHALTTATAGTGSGSVGLNPAGGKYSHGTVVTVTATPAVGSTFNGWSGACSGSGACSVTMDGNKSVTAIFEPTTSQESRLYLPQISR